MQIRKCQKEDCGTCGAIHDRSTPDWLPDPVLAGTHYQKYADVKGVDTEEVLPSKIGKFKKKTMTKEPQVSAHTVTKVNFMEQKKISDIRQSS